MRTVEFTGFVQRVELLRERIERPGEYGRERFFKHLFED